MMFCNIHGSLVITDLRFLCINLLVLSAPQGLWSQESGLIQQICLVLNTMFNLRCPFQVRTINRTLDESSCHVQYDVIRSGSKT